MSEASIKRSHLVSSGRDDAAGDMIVQAAIVNSVDTAQLNKVQRRFIWAWAQLSWAMTALCVVVCAVSALCSVTPLPAEPGPTALDPFHVIRLRRHSHSQHHTPALVCADATHARSTLQVLH